MTYKRLNISPVLIIPFHLIWRIKVQWSQKLALASTLCLTILTIVCTIVRVAGVRTSSNNSSLDTVWQTYWQFITADIALTMTAATAFRTFFTSRHDKEEHRSESSGSWLGQRWRAFKKEEWCTGSRGGHFYSYSTDRATFGRRASYNDWYANFHRQPRKGLKNKTHDFIQELLDGKGFSQ